MFKLHFPERLRLIFNIPVYLVLLTGIILRGVVWYQNRSFIGDEGELLRLIQQRDYAQLFGVYEQACPPIFAAIAKFLVNTFSSTEFVARSLSMFCGVLFLWVYRKALQPFLSPRWVAFALFFVSLGGFYVRYSTEFKQYAADGLVMATLIYLAGVWKMQSNRDVFLWSLVGAICVWCSMPSVFVLAGVGAFFLLENIENQTISTFFYNKKRVFIVGSVWLSSFGIYYWQILRGQIAMPFLQTFHTDYFLVFPPKNLQNAQLLWAQIRDIFDATMGKTTIALIVSIGSYVVGILALWRRDKKWAVLLILPVFLCLFASALGKYSLIRRLMLFVYPLILAVCTFGLRHLLTRCTHIFRIVLSIVLAVVMFNFQDLQYFVKPLKAHDNREVLAYVAQNRNPETGIWIHETVTYAYKYYAGVYKYRFDFGDKVHLAKYRMGDFIVEDIEKVRKMGWKEVWFVFDREADLAHAEAHLKTVGKRLKSVEFHKSWAILYAF